MKQKKAFIATIALLVMMLFPDTNFFYTSFNLFDMLNSASTLMVVAFGITIVIIAGGIDLSVGGALSMAGIVMVKSMNAGMPMWLSIVAAILSGALIGVVNGYLVVYQKTEPFIITLGMSIFLIGLGMQITDAKPVYPEGTELMMMGNGKFLGVPNLVIVMVLVFIGTYILLRYTQYGRNCFAIGGDYEVAEYSGIAVKPIKAFTYVISGSLAALAGVMVTAKLNSGSHLFGEMTALNVISAVVVGGVSLAGGVGGIPQAAIGYLFIAILQNVMNMMGVQPYPQRFILGMVIVLVIALDSYGRKLKREKV